MDLAMALTGLILFCPVLLAVGVFIWLSDGRPVLFTQTRSGLGGRPFQILKFRTMTSERDADGQLRPDRERLKRWGILIRRFSLDELPQLINIILGDMSFVGPRPLLHTYTALYSERQRRRLEVKPGLTGWSQIKGRNQLIWEQRFELDVWYVDHQALWLDLAIVCATFFAVLMRTGISHPESPTMPEFRGAARQFPQRNEGK
jgi:sugar transferase EpsL